MSVRKGRFTIKSEPSHSPLSKKVGRLPIKSEPSNSPLGRKVETTKKGRFTIEKYISNSTSKAPFNAREIAKLNKMICDLKQLLSKHKLDCEH